MCCNALIILTESTNSLEQKKQTHRRTFMIFVTKPTWKTGFASSMCPKWPGHSVMLPEETNSIKSWHQTATAASRSIYIYFKIWRRTCTCLTSPSSFYDPLSRVHKATEFRTSSFCCLGVFDPPLRNGHPFLGRNKPCVWVGLILYGQRYMCHKYLLPHNNSSSKFL